MDTAPSIPSPDDMPRTRSTILLVEDHLESLDVLARLLRMRGYEVRAAPNAAQALAMAGQVRFDLVISDIGLPDLSGLEMMGRLKAKHSLRGIAMTGFEETDLKEARAAGFQRHLKKPVVFNDLIDAVRDVLES